MSVENANFISELVSSSPGGQDPRSEGDDHLRLVKSVLQNQFPNFTNSQVTPTVSQVNKLSDYDLSGTVKEEIEARLPLDQVVSGSDDVPRNSGALMDNLNAELWAGAAKIIKTSDPADSEGNNGDIFFVRES